jgi:uncharacterized membrane protein YdjX (TVP38/TMEM64 family)
LKKKGFIIAIAILIIIALYLANFPSLYYNLKELASNPEEIKDYIIGFGILGPIIIIIIQIIQVIISPIPGMVTSLAAGAIYGVVLGFLLNVLGVLLGSLGAFYLARKFGKPLVIKIIGKRAYEKYNKLVSEKYTIGLFILFFLPFFPDDALCLLAGISAMDLSIFLFFVIVGRAPGLFVSTLVGSGNITLSMPIWIIIGVISIIVIYFSIKYNKEIEKYIYKKIEKQKKRYHNVIEKRRERKDKK